MDYADADGAVCNVQPTSSWMLSGPTRKAAAWLGLCGEPQLVVVLTFLEYVQAWYLL